MEYFFTNFGVSNTDITTENQMLLIEKYKSSLQWMVFVGSK